MSQSQRSTLTDFSTDQDSQWPVEVNGHTVVRVTPETPASGSGDDDLAFECEDCGERIRIPEDRAVPDHEYAANRFSTLACSTDGGLFD